MGKITLSINDLDGTLVPFKYLVNSSKYLERSRIGFSEFTSYMQNMLEKLIRKKVTYDEAASTIIEKLADRLSGIREGDVREKLEFFVDKYGDGFIQQFEVDGKRCNSKQLLERDRKEGKRIVVISASPQIYVKAISRSFGGFDDIIATKLETANGLYTGKIIQNLSSKDGKRLPFIQYLQDTGLEKIDFDNSVARGDSIHDCAFMERVGERYMINPTPELREQLGKLGYEFIIVGGKK